MDNKISAIILAAGCGKRMGTGKNKVLLTIEQKPIFMHSVIKFSQNKRISSIIIVCKEQEYDFILDQTKCIEKDIKIVFGGPQRQDSVYNGLCALAENTKYVMVHDGARPYLKQKTIDRCIDSLLKNGSAVAAVKSIDTIKVIDQDNIKETLDRNTLINVQTPQCFEVKTLMQAHKKAQEECYIGTDESVLVERLGRNIKFVESDYSNIKITTKADLPKQENTMKIGHGVDIHAFAKDRKLIIGGVDIPHTYGLAGHSDADVLTHAIMDSLLGAAGLPDIGNLFPDNDNAYLDISSLILLKKVMENISKLGYTIGNIDCTLEMQAPKIAKYIPFMKKQLATTMDIDISLIGIKATTTEKLGFIGKKQGVRATSVCLLNLQE